MLLADQRSNNFVLQQTESYPLPPATCNFHRPPQESFLSLPNADHYVARIARCLGLRSPVDFLSRCHAAGLRCPTWTSEGQRSWHHLPLSTYRAIKNVIGKNKLLRMHAHSPISENSLILLLLFRSSSSSTCRLRSAIMPSASLFSLLATTSSALHSSTLLL